jgi:cytochrome c peroxidase
MFASSRFTRSRWCVAAVLVLAAAACSDGPMPPRVPLAKGRLLADRGPGPDPALVTLVRQLAAGRQIVPLAPPPHIREPLVRLGRALLFDPILSGNRNIACATCHFPTLATGDGKSLAVGEGGIGVGPTREHPAGVFIPRNAPPLFDLASMRHLFLDGRIERDASGVVHTPAGAQVTPDMARAFEFGPASAIGMFPVTNRAEMRGQVASGNELAAIDDSDLPGIWRALMRRLGRIPEYREMFAAAYPGKQFSELTFANASNAMAAFMVDQLTFADAPWDRFLRGDDDALTNRQLQGAQTFLTLKCSICHNGATLSDDEFHNVAVAQIGPGEGDGASGHDDFGRMRVTHDASDRYRFRTSPLRNVELTGPYGHDGAITTLRGFVEHYSQSDLKLQTFDPLPLEPALRSTLQPTASAILAQRDTLLNGVVLSSQIVDALMDYMQVLTDERARHLDRLIPARVPSGLPVQRP